MIIAHLITDEKFIDFFYESVKDIEDVEGDREMECRTVPIVWGIAKTKIVAYVLGAVTIALLAYFSFFKILRYCNIQIICNFIISPY